MRNERDLDAFRRRVSAQPETCHARAGDPAADR